MNNGLELPLQIYVVDQQLALLLSYVYFDMFLENIVLKNVSSNDADSIRDLRFILIAAQKNYVLNALLGADADVMNVQLAQYDDYLVVLCTMLYGLESGLQRRFERHGPYETFQELKLIFPANTRVERYEVSNKFYS